MSRSQVGVRAYLLRHKATFTKQAGGDLRALCLSPQWLLTSVATRPIGEIVADLQLGDDPDLTRLARTLQQGAHLFSDRGTPRHRVDTFIAWMSADTRLRRIADRCMAELQRVHLRLLWAVRPTGAGRTHTLRRHGFRVVGCCFSTDDRYLASVDREGGVLLWDVESGAYVATLDARRVYGDRMIEQRPGIRIQVGAQWTRVLAGGDSRVAVLTFDGVLAVWSLADEVAPVYALDTAAAGGDSATFLFGVDGETFMTRADDSFRLHSWRSGEVLLAMPLNGQWAQSTVDDTGQLLAVEAAPSVMDVWDLRERRRVRQLRIGGGDVQGLALDAGLLVVVKENGVGRLWDWVAGRRIDSYRGVFDMPQVDAADRKVRYLRRPGELVVVDVAPSGGLSRWFAKGRRARVANRDEYDRAIPVRLDDRVLATVIRVEQETGGDELVIQHQVDFFDLRNGRSLASGSHAGAPLEVTRGPDPGQLLIVTSGGEVTTWDLGLDRVRRARTVIGNWGITAAAVSHDRKVVAVSVFNDVRLLRPTEEQEEDVAYELPNEPIDLLADPAGNWLATLDSQLVVDIWDPLTGRLRFECPGTAHRVFRNAMDMRLFSPDGRWIAVNDWDGSVLIWDPATGRLVGRLDPKAAGRTPTDVVHAAAGRAGPIVVVRGDGGLTIWDVAAERQLGTLPQAKQICGDAAGHWLACRDNQGVVTIFNLEVGRAEQLPSQVKGLVATPDGRQLYLWDEHQVKVVRWPNRALETVSSLPGALGVDRVLVDSQGSRPVVVRTNGSLVRLGMEGSELRPSLAGGADLRWLLSPGGQIVAVASSSEVELIDLTRPSARASVTVDGPIAGMTWVRERSILLAGAFGMQAMALAPPPPSGGRDPPSGPHDLRHPGVRR